MYDVIGGSPSPLILTARGTEIQSPELQSKVYNVCGFQINLTFRVIFRSTPPYLCKATTVLPTPMNPEHSITVEGLLQLQRAVLVASTANGTCAGELFSLRR